MKKIDAHVANAANANANANVNVIKFAEWILKEGWTNNGKGKWLKDDGSMTSCLTSEVLYEEYKRYHKLPLSWSSPVIFGKMMGK